ncbi:hypothetical protein [Salisediminibacterium beveridgei]|uniref:Uncharacterized protein n=1 Tax=Salisediminibacterium beveridgei TaxID=632773 RepID=A0A1D7QXP4_9BACI|nr:hypothetical protein [Salisediminibacterium beveridgei]AOM83787.1 hypothetical protein BBEV_2447 [Salisediminibacterium beveridgei]
MILLTGYIASCLILFNSGYYVLFLLIRKSRNRLRQVRMAKIAKRLMLYHRKIAVLSGVFVVLHAGQAIVAYGLTDLRPVQWTGLAALSFYLVLLSSGWIRNQKATGRRKRAHRMMALSALMLIIIHAGTSLLN